MDRVPIPPSVAETVYRRVERFLFVPFEQNVSLARSPSSVGVIALVGISFFWLVGTCPTGNTTWLFPSAQTLSLSNRSVGSYEQGSNPGQFSKF